MNVLKSMGFWLVIFQLLVVPCSLANNVVPIKGVGIFSMKAVYMTAGGALRWGDDFASLNYVVTDSDEAVRRVSRKESDFAVTDFALLLRDLDREKLLQFPIMATAIVPVVNLPGIKPDQLQLTGAVLADIMSGKINQWNSVKIRALNPGLDLPALPINRIVRADASGATLAFTKYLSRHSVEFSKSVGIGRSVSWPGSPRKARDDNEIAAVLAATPGAISYVDMATGNLNEMKFVSLIHSSGSVVKADISFLGAGVLSQETNENGLIESGALTVVELGQNWPIVLPVYVVIRQNAVDDETCKAMLRFFFLNLRKNDLVIADKGFVSLPASLQMKTIKIFRKVQSQSGSPLHVDFDYLN